MVNSVIIDTKEPVKKLRQYIRGLTPIAGRDFVSDIMQDLVYEMRESKYATDRVGNLIAEISGGKYQYGYTLLDTRLTAPVMHLAMHIADRFREYGIYLPDGTLPYVCVPVHNVNFHDLLLTRIYELSYQPTQT